MVKLQNNENFLKKQDEYILEKKKLEDENSNL